MSLCPCVWQALEQEKYSLQRNVQLQARMLESLQSDHDLLKAQQRRQLEEQKEHLEGSHSMALRELHSKVSCCPSALTHRVPTHP